MFVKEPHADFKLLDVIREEMIAGKMTVYRRNDIIDYLKRIVAKFRRSLYIPPEIFAMRQLIENMCDIEDSEYINDEILEEPSVCQ